MGITESWAVTSKMLRRLSLSRSKLIDLRHSKQDNAPSTKNDGVGRARAARRKVEKLPLAVHILDDPSSINQQSGCNLFTKLPAELRGLIWEYALTGYEDLNALYPLDKPYARPGQAAPLRVAVELLLTCRAVYLEAFLVPFQVNPMIVFDGHPDVVPPNNLLQCTASNLRLCSKLKPWQFANICSVDMTVQQFMLEGGSIERASRIVGNKGRHEGHEARGFTLAGYASFGPAKETKTLNRDIPLSPGAAETRAALIRSIFRGKRVTHLTIRMSRTDWWSWTSHPQAETQNPHEMLRLEPMINVTDRQATSSAMLEGYEARKEGREPDFELDEFEKQGRWGMHFAEYWPDLQTLELVLETYEGKEKQLDSVVECAKLWTFPLHDGKQLEWNGEEEASVRWRGAHEYEYDADLGISWTKDQLHTQESRRNDAAVTQWRPTPNHQAETEPGQEFVIKSLVFTRRRSVDSTVSFDL
ncbi:hypothetical protein F5Y19DRAFT_463965 [Xylariaceae sp. FL1651]|nr:hypothetical protein F5Y19DRAFT_463965 [Xylariaceae sp. FL1651]